MHFSQAANRAFAFLVDPFSFKLASSDELRVSYVRADMAVTIGHDRLSYELGIALARLDKPEECQRPYNMADFVRVADPVLARQYRRFTATTAVAVQKGLDNLAQELQVYGRPALLGSESFFRNLKQGRDDAAREFGREMEERGVRREAEKAWHSRDYTQVVASYSRIEGALTESEKGRLRFARKRSGSPQLNEPPT